MVELYEEDIEDWYYHHKDTKPIMRYLCEGIVLRNENRSNLLKSFIGLFMLNSFYLIRTFILIKIVFMKRKAHTKKRTEMNYKFYSDF